MPKHLEILGKNLSPEAKEDVATFLGEHEKKGKELFEGELEKSKKDTSFIKGVKTYFNRKFQRIDLDYNFQMDHRQVHFLSHEGYEVLTADSKTLKDSNAYYDPTFCAIFIDISKIGSREDLYKTIVHETVHMASLQKFLVQGSVVTPYRGGYGVLSQKQKTGLPRVYFMGFNEALTDAITEVLFFKHKDELKQKFGIDFEKIKLSYRAYIAIVNVIANKLAIEGKESIKDVYKRFERGLFSGDMMHLRRIERVFGKNALRVLGVLGCVNSGFSDEELFKKVLRFFRSESEIERTTIAQELLSGKVKHFTT